MPPKHDDATATEKMLALYSLLLLDDKPHSLTHLAERFRCSKPTIMRLIEKIASFEGITLHEKKRAEGGRTQKWYWLERVPNERERRCMGLSALQMRLLRLSRDIAAPFLPESVRDSLDESLRRASVLLPQDAQRSKAGSRTLPLVQPVIWGGIDYGPFQHILQNVLKAIEYCHVCEIIYQAHDKDESLHEMAATSLVSGRQALYLRGWKVADKGTPQALHPLFLAVHRIRAVTLTQRIHTLPPPPEESGFGIMGGDAFWVRAQFSGEVSTYLRERYFGPDQTIEDTDGGDIILSFTARSEPEVLSWLLSFGGKAHVLEPQWLANALREEARTLLARYGNFSTHISASET